MQTVEFHPRGAFESGEGLDAFSGSEGASPRIAIAEDHCMILRWIMRYVKRNEWPYGRAPPLYFCGSQLQFRDG